MYDNIMPDLGVDIYIKSVLIIQLPHRKKLAYVSSLNKYAAWNKPDFPSLPQNMIIRYMCRFTITYFPCVLKKRLYKH
jgi:hypothetical protein